MALDDRDKRRIVCTKMPLTEEEERRIMYEYEKIFYDVVGYINKICTKECNGFLRTQKPVSEDELKKIREKFHGKSSILTIDSWDEIGKNVCFNLESVCNHEAGMTPIDGFVICKKCGKDLKEV